MSAELLRYDERRMTHALDELRALIREKYPKAAFDVAPAPDDSSIVHLYASVDVDGPDEVLDIVIDRLVDMQAEEGLPLFVIPRRPPERLAARWHAARPYAGHAVLDE